MDFSLTAEQKEYEKEVRKFAASNLNVEGTMEVFSKELWKKIADFGLLGIIVDEKYGGLEEDFLTAAIVMESLGYGCENNGLVFAVTNHIWVALNIIYLYGTEFLKDKYLPSMVSGDLIGAFALTEADSGSDALQMETFAEKTEDGYLLNGSKMFISNGPIADVFIVIARMDRESVKYSAFVVEKSFVGVEVGKPIEKMGLNACPFSEVRFENCLIPAENLLGREGIGQHIMAATLEWERCYEFAPHVGAMRRVMEECKKYVNERHQFNRPIKDFQAISHKIADMEVSIEMAKNMLYKVAWIKDQGKRAFKESAILKLYVSENYIKICQDAMQIFGAYGYTKDYKIERELRDALACSIYSGTSEIQRNTIFQMI